MREIQKERYGPVATELIQKAATELRPQALAFGTPVGDAQTALRSMTDQNVSQNRRVRMPADAEALRAGLWLLFDFMEESHTLSQNIATPSGSYWHAILHRREPDPSNAKYWVARVGEHPILPELLRDAREIAAAAANGAGQSMAAKLQIMTAWNGAWYVDQCSTASDAATLNILLEIQRREWALLFDYNFQKAFA